MIHLKSRNVTNYKENVSHYIMDYKLKLVKNSEVTNFTKNQL